MTGFIILDAVIILVIVGILAAVILFFISKKFHVEEDPRIDKIAEVLPGANCGGCGFAGCRNLAETIVKQGSMDGCACPAGGAKVSTAIAAIMGIEATEMEPKVAVVRCQGTPENAPAKVQYDSAMTCIYANSIFVGENGCANACLGCGDCTKACHFAAIVINPLTHLPEVNEELCGGCGGCARACPRHIIEIRPKGPKGRKVVVACNNTEKGAICMKNCKMACIGCGKCVKVCPFEAITVENNLAHIDETKCRLCRKCVAECPRHAIIALNFPNIEKKEEANNSADNK